MRWRRSTTDPDRPAVAAKAEEALRADKGWMAMGGFDPTERNRVLDLLDFQGRPERRWAMEEVARAKALVESLL